jgi:hypothetical protein
MVRRVSVARSEASVVDSTSLAAKRREGEFAATTLQA